MAADYHEGHQSLETFRPIKTWVIVEEVLTEGPSTCLTSRTHYDHEDLEKGAHVDQWGRHRQMSTAPLSIISATIGLPKTLI